MEHDARAWRPQAFGRAAARKVRDPLVEPGWDGTRVLVHHAAGAPIRIADAKGTDITTRCGRVPAALAEAILADTAVIDGYLTYQATRTLVSTLPDSEVPQSMGGHMARFMLGGAAGLISNQKADKYVGARGEAALRAEPGDDADDVDVDVGNAATANGTANGTNENGTAHGTRDRRTPPAGPDAPPAPDSILAFVAIDLLEVDRIPLLDVPLLERKRVLESVLVENLLVRCTPFVREPASTFIVSWRAAGFEELVYKDPNSRYTPGLPNNGWALAPMPRR